MRCWNVNSAIFPAVLAALLLVCMRPAVADGASQVEVLSSQTEADEGWYVLEADIRFDFDEELLEALKHGVKLDIDVLVEIKRHRKWLWDPVVSSHRLAFTLQHHPLTGAFIVTQPISGTRHEFSDVQDALQFLGTIRNYHLLNTTLLEPGAHHDGYIMARLNIDTLPAPLQPVAYVSRKWRAESEWLKWEVD